MFFYPRRIQVVLDFPPALRASLERYRPRAAQPPAAPDTVLAVKIQVCLIIQALHPSVLSMYSINDMYTASLFMPFSRSLSGICRG